MRKGLGALLLAGLLGTAAGQTIVGEKYHVIQVENFTVDKSVELPPDYFADLQKELVQKLQETQKFTAVLPPDAKPDPQAVCVGGVITGFNQGSRAGRYFGGFGAGSARLFAHVKYRDCGSGELVIEEKVVGTLSGGLFGGNAKNVSHDFARTLADATKLVLWKNLPKAGQMPEQEPPTVESDVKIVSLTADNFVAGEQELNQLAADGYHLVMFSPTGKNTGEARMEKLAGPAPKYELRVLHTKLISNLEKDLNKLAGEGYRLVPHTMSSMGGFSVIAERATGASDRAFQYRIESAVWMSNAEKNIREFQGKGFELIDTAQLYGPRIVVMAKASEKP